MANENVIRYGNRVNYWIQTETEMDLSRGSHQVEACETTGLPIVYAPARTALVIIDMQNFFCSEELGRPAMARELVPAIQTAVEHARSSGIHVIWLNWGVRGDLSNLPPAVIRSFSRSGIYSGFGSELPNGRGRLLVRDSWSADLIEGLSDLRRPDDIWVDKHRTSGFFGTELNQILMAQGITTLFFAGVNTDQCVMGTLQDAYCIGYDCVVLTDCTATSSPTGAYEAVLYNVERSYGFLTTSLQFSHAASKKNAESI